MKLSYLCQKTFKNKKRNFFIPEFDKINFVFVEINFLFHIGNIKKNNIMEIG